MERQFSVGDRIQFNAPDKSLAVANRDLATVEATHPDGRLSARLGDNRIEKKLNRVSPNSTFYKSGMGNFRKSFFRGQLQSGCLFDDIKQRARAIDSVALPIAYLVTLSCPVSKYTYQV